MNGRSRHTLSRRQPFSGCWWWWRRARAGLDCGNNDADALVKSLILHEPRFTIVRFVRIFGVLPETERPRRVEKRVGRRRFPCHTNGKGEKISSHDFGAEWHPARRGERSCESNGGATP